MLELINEVYKLFCSEPFDITSSVFTVITGEEWPLDIIKAQTAKPEPHYSFLSIVFGIVADVDIESEKYRYMGDVRFSVMSVIKIMERKTFSGKFSYLPAEDNDGCTQASNLCHLQEQNLEDGKSQYVNLSDGRLQDDKLSDEKLKECKLNSDSLSSVILNYDAVDRQKSEKDSRKETSNLKNGQLDNVNVGDNFLGGTNGTCGKLNECMPDLHEPIPDSWNVIEDEFVGWVFVSPSHIGKNVCCAPDASYGDGIIHCICLKGDITRMELLSVLSKMSAGDHTRVRGVSMIRARAFRLETSSTQSEIITIDGERFEWSNLQAEICRGLGRVRCRGPSTPARKSSKER